MKIDYDPIKNKRNMAKHGLSLSKAAEFEFATALVVVDDRKDYGEIRYQAIGYVGNRLHALCFTQRSDDMRPISLRKANKREISKYDKAFTTNG